MILPTIILRTPYFDYFRQNNLKFENPNHFFNHQTPIEEKVDSQIDHKKYKKIKKENTFKPRSCLKKEHKKIEKA